MEHLRRKEADELALLAKKIVAANERASKDRTWATLNEQDAYDELHYWLTRPRKSFVEQEKVTV